MATSALDPFSRLPTELVIAVFAHHAADEPLGPLTARSVCRRWLHITDSTPILWRRIVLDNTALKLPSLHHQALLYLQRSEPFLLDVEVRTHDPDRVLPILSPLLPAVSRWRTFSTAGFRNEHIQMTDLPLSSKAPDPLPLDRLVLTLYEFDFDELDDEPDTEAGSAGKTRFPTFTEDGQMHLRTSALPSFLELAPLHFTHLTIGEGILEATHTNAAAILDLLLATPALRVLVFEGWQHDDEPLAYSTPLPLVALPYLEVLHIRTTCITRRLLSRLDTPRLHTLVLAYLNVDFRVRSAEYTGEDGDSDDEAHDFSQSPWSDHATGMGLRSLIARSRPPLKVLEMDYSDMRTKDFQWVFDRLPELEEFRIVASDMSNRVIGLLRPTYNLDDGSVHLRVPRLRKLCLDHCQRLSGDAVVAALVTRARFTDSASDTHLYSKLADVLVSACEQVDGRHEAMLTRALGRRFRC
ncbi:hypothetical protein D9611_009437 [Ephemerocybe angulata]|uniref:F-box domain-containing protein n=1 Tax=Ephemerocybe angulata TaxID=980116 RepID=A0A8H5ETR4_9AGAR|nr:hypothetical protein D9611_009437 [Tulosesus angulatus]